MKNKTKTLFVTGICGIALSAGAFASTEPSVDRPDGSKIDFYLNKAEPSKAAQSLLVLVQGSDCNSVYHNDNINKTFSQVMPEADVLTVEKYGIDSDLTWDMNPDRSDCPQKYLENDSLDQRVTDYQQVIASLKEVYQYQRIVVLGGSEGAVVTNLLASHKGLVDQSIALNGGGQWFVDDVLHSIRSEVPSEAVFEEIKTEFMAFVNYLKHGEPSEFVESGHGYAWWKAMVEVDQKAAISQVETPLLIIQAERDSNVSVEQTSLMVNQLAKKQANITYKTYPDLDHGFQRSGGDDGASEVVNDISAWLKQF